MWIMLPMAIGLACDQGKEAFSGAVSRRSRVAPALGYAQTSDH